MPSPWATRRSAASAARRSSPSCTRAGGDPNRSARQPSMTSESSIRRSYPGRAATVRQPPVADATRDPGQSEYAVAAMKDYLPSPDAPTQKERQRKRLKLLLQGHVAYLPTDAFLLWLYVIEAISGLVFWSFIAAHVLINVGFVALVLSGLNRRLPDRSLGHYSIMVGVLSNLAVLASIGEYRAIYVVFCVTPFLSAAFKLNLRQVAGLLALAQLGYLAVIAGLWAAG